MAKCPSIEDVIGDLRTQEGFLRDFIPDHKDIFDEVASSVGVIATKRDAISQHEKEVFYRRVANVIYYVLHVQGESAKCKEKYWNDLVQYRTTYRNRIEYTDRLLELASIIDSDVFDWEMLQNWKQAKGHAMAAVGFAEQNPDITLANQGFSRAINESFQQIETIRKHLAKLYDEGKPKP